MPALPPYRLQTVLQLRERKKEAAEAALGSAIAALQKEQQLLAQMEAELAAMVQKRLELRRTYMEQAMRGEISAQKAIDTNVFVRRMQAQEKDQQEAIDGQHQVIARRQEDVDQARALLTTATQELKALQKHREDWELAWRREQQRREEESLDELAQTIFLRGGGSSQPPSGGGG